MSLLFAAVVAIYDFVAIYDVHLSLPSSTEIQLQCVSCDVETQQTEQESAVRRLPEQLEKPHPTNIGRMGEMRISLRTTNGNAL